MWIHQDTKRALLAATLVQWWFSGWILLGKTPGHSLAVLFTVQMLTLLVVPFHASVHGRGGSQLQLFFAELQDRICVSLQLQEGWFRRQYSRKEWWIHAPLQQLELWSPQLWIRAHLHWNWLKESWFFNGVHYPRRWTSVSTNIKRHPGQNNEGRPHQLIPE